MFSAQSKGMDFLGSMKFQRGTGRAILLMFLVAFAIAPTTRAADLTARAGALAKDGNQEVSISFSAPVLSASATDLNNYSLSPDGTIEEARYVPLANAAILTVSGLTLSNSYTLSVNNVVGDPDSTLTIQTNLTFTARDMTWAGVGRNETGIPQDVVAIGDDAFTLVSGALVFFSSAVGFSYEETTFAYEPIAGDFDRAVQVEHQDAGSEWSRAGLMVREAVDEGLPRQNNPDDPSQAFSRYQAVQVNPAILYDGTPANNQYEINRRMQPGFDTEEPEVSNNTAPLYPDVWVRLVRSGSTFRMYRSDTGTNWIKLGETVFDPPFATNAFVGVHFSPELANLPQDDPSYGQKLARFSHYGDPHAPIEITTPTINIESTPTGAQITFVGTLQSAPAVTGSWTNVVASSPFLIPNGTTGSKFFRAKAE